MPTGRAESRTGVLGITDARALTADDFEPLALPAALTREAVSAPRAGDPW